MVSLLRDLEAVGADYVKTSNFLDQLNTTAKIRPSYGFEAVLSISRDWLITDPLIDFNGNAGSPTDPPAEPRYTEVRLSKLGEQIADAEAGLRPPIPFGLVVGDFFAGGDQPAFNARNVEDALLALHRQRDISDIDLFELLGHPRFPSGCEVVGDIGALLRGERIDLLLSSSVEQSGPAALEITRIPQEVLQAGVWIENCFQRVEGLRSVRNESMRGRYLWAVDVLSDADIEDVKRRLEQMWPLRLEVSAQIPSSWRQLATSWLDEFPADADLQSAFDTDWSS